MRFQLLGPLSITDGRDVVVLPPAKPTSLLAALLVRPGEVVPAHRLREAVWGEEQPATAKAALQSCVLRLRRLFAKYDIEEQAVVAVAGGYRVPADGDTLDLLHFRRLVSEASSAGEAELPLLRTALGLWRGPLLANVPSELLHRDEVPRLVEERLRVLERVCEIQLARGRCREVLVDLWEATRTHPQHEGFAAQLMRALYRVGRQIEALAEYRRIRTHLREELGVDPGAELQRLELAILRGDDPGGPGAPAAAVAVLSDASDTTGGREPAAAPAVTTGLPQPDGPQLPEIPGFAGRARETALLTEVLNGGPRDARRTVAPVLAVVSGGPGMGKTALVLHAARQAAGHYPGGGVLLPLTGPDGQPRTADDATSALRAALPHPRHGPCLVVLDDVVHPDQVRDLLDVPGCGAVVVTSRMGLAALVATHGPVVLPLAALTPVESRDLLTAVLGGGRVTAEPAEAADLAEICGHVPLALRIVAARLLTRPRLRLADCLALLRRDPPAWLALPDDPRMSVPLILEGALGRLPSPVAEAHLRLARCEGRITPAVAAAELAAPEADAEELLERLLDAGLLEEEQPGAFRMNALFRAHALRAARSGGPPPPSVAVRRALPSAAG
ncbi:BTAD domain-containing putative transcriptional regulator [Streptomyces sp. NPDC059169]|uniref:BTAD domain-containing putative transcriptional regulator n=1 Tax=Streptomyces sp. NPDC059169 TaxID=3346754 RepID=UPI00367586A3